MGAFSFCTLHDDVVIELGAENYLVFEKKKFHLRIWNLNVLVICTISCNPEGFVVEWSHDFDDKLKLVLRDRVILKVIPR